MLFAHLKVDIVKGNEIYDDLMVFESMKMMGPQTIADFVRLASSRMSEAGVVHAQGFADVDEEARYLVSGLLHLMPDRLEEYWHCRLLPEEAEKISKGIDRRVVERVPVAYLTGEAWFCGMNFRVSPDVLIPRSPFAELIRERFQPWLRHAPGRILDLCTGSGCIGIACAEAFPDAEVDLVDISPAALALARENVDLHGLADRINVIESDLFKALGDERYDLIVSNPPYVSKEEMEALPEEFRHEPTLALEAGEDGMDLVLEILADAPDYMHGQSLLFVEVGYSQHFFEQLLPHFPATWPEFAHGGSGIFMTEHASLVHEKALCRRLLEERSSK